MAAATTAPTIKHDQSLLLNLPRLLTSESKAPPFTLIVDTIQQSGLPLLRYALSLAVLQCDAHIILVCTKYPPRAITADLSGYHIIDRRPQFEGGLLTNVTIDHGVIESEIMSLISNNRRRKHLIIFDNLDLMLQQSTRRTVKLLHNLKQLAIKQESNSRIIALYTTPTSTSLTRHLEASTHILGTPLISNTLAELATTSLTVYPIAEAKKWAPLAIVDEEAERRRGWVRIDSNNPDLGIIIYEHRKVSGKVTREACTYQRLAAVPTSRWVFSPLELEHDTRHSPPEKPAGGAGAPPSSSVATTIATTSTAVTATPTKLSTTDIDPNDPTANLSFNLRLTDEQRKAKESVELPYMKAQVASAQMQGEREYQEAGQIIYQPDADDDWDEDDPDDDLEI